MGQNRTQLVFYVPFILLVKGSICKKKSELFSSLTVVLIHLSWQEVNLTDVIGSLLPLWLKESLNEDTDGTECWLQVLCRPCARMPFLGTLPLRVLLLTLWVVSLLPAGVASSSSPAFRCSEPGHLWAAPA